MALAQPIYLQSQNVQSLLMRDPNTSIIPKNKFKKDKPILRNSAFRKKKLTKEALFRDTGFIRDVHSAIPHPAGLLAACSLIVP